MTDHILEFRGVTKRFMGITANDHIDLKIRTGEIHALLGENGAGKSTLMNVLVGLYTPDEGQILMHGKEVQIKNPTDSIHLGIGMVHQHFKLVPTLSVGENIVMGHDGLKTFYNKKKIYSDLAEISETYNLPIRPEAGIHELSAGEMQRVEIVKMLYRNVELLVLDEPTSVLTPHESQMLFQNLMKMKEQGKTIIFISHKLNEVMQIADRVSVLRRGKLITTLNKEDTDAQSLARIMVGRDMQSMTRYESKGNFGEEIVSAKGLYAVGDRGETVLEDVSLNISAGEILGIAGVSGNGQSQLARALTGMESITKGTIVINGEDLSQGKPIDFIDAGVGHIPEDRIGVGCIANFSSLENIILKNFRRSPVKKGVSINYAAATEISSKLVEEFDVRLVSLKEPVRLLSGGNMQKLIFAREMAENPKFVVAIHPTYGLDIAAVDMVHQFLSSLRERGCAILLISEDLDELFALSDNIAVMFKGTLTEKRANQDWSIDDISGAMMGLAQSKPAEEAQEGGV